MGAKARLQLLLENSRILVSLNGKNYVRCQSLFMCKRCLVLLKLVPADMKISHGCLYFRVSKCKGLWYSHQM